ncbi:DUF3540 domain-containing protein [Sorangium sp. So ce542]|uniref:DUF3540 domain-containing protein n=1 Tax=Sorangium sp. So ce542 TaxID=3133316 RepID=UPI003F61D0C7
MHSAAPKLEARAVYQEFGEVISAGPDGVRVRTALAELAARRAVGCLVEPQAGDRVLVATEEGGESFVLSVLTRPAPGPTVLAADGDLVLRSRRGKVGIAAQEGVDLASGAAVRVTSSALEIAALSGRVTLERIEVFGAAVKAELGKVKLVASTFDAVLDRLSQRAKRVYRAVEEIDQVRARQLDYAAEGNAHIRGENALVTATDVVKISAEQVHLN